MARRLHAVSSAGPEAPETGSLGAEAASVLVEGLRSMVTVTSVPLGGVVAVLDTRAEAWVLYLDTDSPVEDRCWAMVEVLDVLRRGPEASRHASQAPPVRLLRS